MGTVSGIGGQVNGKPIARWRAYVMTESDKALVEALSGALGSVVGTWCFFPLDTVKTRYQASTRIRLPDGRSTRSAKNMAEVFQQAVKDEGPRVLYRGVGVKTVHSLAQSFVYFYAFAYLRRTWEARTGAKIGVGANLAVGMLAGWCNVLLTEPLDTMATACQTTRLPLIAEEEEPDGQRDLRPLAAPAGGPCEIAPAAPARGAAAAGPKGLYRSLWASLLLTCNPAIQYTAFEQARRRLLVLKAAAAAAAAGGGALGPEMSASEAFLLGAASKACATLLTYPAIRSKVLLQAGRSQTSTLVGTMRAVLANEGAGGLYKGLSAQLLKTVMVAALMQMVKEKSFGAAYVAVAWARSRGAARAVAGGGGAACPAK